MLSVEKLRRDLIDILGRDAVVGAVRPRLALVCVPQGLRDEIEVIARDASGAEYESLTARVGCEVLDGESARAAHLREHVL